MTMLSMPAGRTESAAQQAVDDVAVFDDVSKSFGPVTAIENLSFTITREQLVSVVGVTGCGKSTTFNLMLGLFPPSAGTVRIFGHDPYAEFGWYRKRVAVVFQDARLLPWRTAYQNVCIGMKFAGIPRDGWRDCAMQWLERLGLAGREHSYPHQLSGGQRQRVSLARAFAVDPELILCDESFSALDEVTAERLRGEFVHLVRDGKKTAVVITHNLTEAVSLGDRALAMRSPGQIVADLALTPSMTAAERDELRSELLAILRDDGAAAEPADA
jgi:NitT/TauT family transport system ATP-binding protein